MLHYSEYVKNLMLNYPEEARTLFAEVERKLDTEPAFGDRFDALITAYMINETMDLDTALDGAKALADDMGYHEYTLHFIFIMNCTEILMPPPGSPILYLTNRWTISGASCWSAWSASTCPAPSLRAGTTVT